jgi:hypothetical protein
MIEGCNGLRHICEEKLNRDDIDRSAVLMLEWIRDVKQLAGIAEWSWCILEPLFGLERYR